jgi:hypothetical protein
MRDIMVKMIIFMHRTLAMTAATVVILLLPPVVGQMAQPEMQVGMLACEMAPRTSVTLRSVQSIRCHFVPDGRDAQQAYIGEIETVGPDVGVSTGGVLVWDVLASTRGQPAGGLAGVYVGVNGDISVSGGEGPNVLFGGSARTIVLRPLALEGEIDVALGLGLSSLKLAAAY